MKPEQYTNPEAEPSPAGEEFENLMRATASYRESARQDKIPPKLKNKLNFAMAALAFAMYNPEAAQAQMVNTADTTGGKGNTGTTVSISYLNDPNFWQKYSFIAQSLGISNNLDFMAGIAHTSIKTSDGAPSETQFSGFGGVKYNFLGGDKGLPKFSLLGLLSQPLNEREKGVTTLYTAFIASKAAKIKKFEFTPYGGFTSLVPIGNPQNKLFAPPSPQQSVAAGVYKNLGNGLALYGEYNFGVGLNKGKMFTLGLDFPGQKVGKLFKRHKKPEKQRN